MFRSLVIGLAFLAVAASKPSHQYGWADMVQPLAWTSASTDMFGDEMGPPTVKNHCTAWSYRVSGDLDTLRWITAAHCVTDRAHQYESHDYQIQSQFVYVETWDALNDIASLADYSDVHAKIPSHRISSHNPQVDDDPQTPSLIVRGHPFGYDELFTTFGYLTALNFHDEEDPAGVFYNVYQVPIAPGSSGSPVYDRDDRVVGLLQVGWGQDGFSAISGGLSLTTLRTFLQSLP